jgi:hypothetical protein
VFAKVRKWCQEEEMVNGVRNHFIFEEKAIVFGYGQGGKWCQRARRVYVGGMIYHALNLANFRSRLFRETSHYEDFLGSDMR